MALAPQDLEKGLPQAMLLPAALGGHGAWFISAPDPTFPPDVCPGPHLPRS